MKNQAFPGGMGKIRRNYFLHENLSLPPSVCVCLSIYLALFLILYFFENYFLHKLFFIRYILNSLQVVKDRGIF